MGRRWNTFQNEVSDLGKLYNHLTIIKVKASQIKTTALLILPISEPPSICFLLLITYNLNPITEIKLDSVCFWTDCRKWSLYRWSVYLIYYRIRSRILSRRRMEKLLRDQWLGFIFILHWYQEIQESLPVLQDKILVHRNNCMNRYCAGA